MARTRIAGGFAAFVLASCSVEEPEPSRDVLPTDDSQKTTVTMVRTGAAENAGLRADFKAP